MAEVAEMHPHLPRVDHSWTTGTILASITSTLSLLGMLASISWYSATANAKVEAVPDIIRAQQDISRAVAILQTQSQNNDGRFADIQYQLRELNRKIDESNGHKGN